MKPTILVDSELYTLDSVAIVFNYSIKSTVTIMISLVRSMGIRAEICLKGLTQVDPVARLFEI